jgi:ABC-2 type transport system permease protein
MLTFAKRCAKEIVRDPINLCFGLGFPLVLLYLLSALQSNIPVPLFEIEHLAPGVAVFGLSFMTLFSATLVAKDRTSSLLQRLYTTPMKPLDFILGYILPLLPISLMQSAICYLVAFFLGLAPSVNILLALVFILPISLLFVALGLLFGSILNDKAVGGICGALLTNLSAWLSGIWFDLELVGGVFY